MKDILYPIPGYEGRYSITKKGDVWSWRSHRWLKQGINCEYKEVRLQNNISRLDDFKQHNSNDYSLKYRVHDLVALVFLEDPSDNYVVDHINGDKLDNNVDNLRWCTIYENNTFPLALQHKREAGLKRRKKVS